MTLIVMKLILGVVIEAEVVDTEEEVNIEDVVNTEDEEAIEDVVNIEAGVNTEDEEVLEEEEVIVVEAILAGQIKMSFNKVVVVVMVVEAVEATLVEVGIWVKKIMKMKMMVNMRIIMRTLIIYINHPGVLMVVEEGKEEGNLTKVRVDKV